VYMSYASEYFNVALTKWKVNRVVLSVLRDNRCIFIMSVLTSLNNSLLQAVLDRLCERRFLPLLNTNYIRSTLPLI
jgi:hypothetical protein